MLAVPYICFAWHWVKVCIKRKDMQWFLFFVCFIYLFVITVVPYKFLTIFIFMMADFDWKRDEAKTPAVYISIIGMLI